MYTQSISYFIFQAMCLNVSHFDFESPYPRFPRLLRSGHSITSSNFIKHVRELSNFGRAALCFPSTAFETYPVLPGPRSATYVLVGGSAPVNIRSGNFITLSNLNRAGLRSSSSVIDAYPVLPGGTCFWVALLRLISAGMKLNGRHFHRLNRN